MQIKKVLNNNVVVTENEQQKELVMMGRGLAFQKKIGEEIELEKVEKTFVLEGEGFTDKLAELLSEIPEQYFEIAAKIINFATSRLSYKLDDYIYVALTDHLSFAISRYKQGINLSNALLWEIKKFYKNEYEVAKEALTIINEELGIKLPDDEAGSIALHLVNSQLSGENVEATVKVTKMVNSILTIVKYHYNIEIDETSLNYERFLTHLKFFALRFIRNEGKEHESIDAFLFEQIKTKYKKAYDCSEKIAAFVAKSYNWDITDDEKVYLSIHIHRVTSREAQKRQSDI
ncbi:BglG family transcription antiterminator LicT [Paraliobacillus sediminis]|uniref:BglG family transcription antiterminator LicT n=1 Tax=Paraliobacillus sediminis TaxID=1885916 RepID=UPI000E3EC7F6|nr:PRD domain-containing protein [Paraliobacillus sediminis]